MYRIVSVLTACILVVGLLFAMFHLLSVKPAVQPIDEIHAIWISYIDISMLDEQNKDQTAFEHKAKKMLENIASIGLDTVFLHVRPFSDALYRSDVFPWSACLTGKQGVDPGYDPLKLFCELAAQYHVQVHAWINPFRICSDETKWNEVCEDNPAKRLLSDTNVDNDAAVVHVAGGVYYDPASPAVQQLILAGVCELLERYPIEGIHIDDYFYPAQDTSIDEAEYAAYRENGGTLPLDDWRRNTVNAWVKNMYQTVKSYGDDKIFSISPAVNTTYNRDVLYADTERWCSESGYCDWIIPQLYVGFEHETMPFDKAAAEWNRMKTAKSVRMLFGLAAYKSGQTDNYAGSGATEWIRCSDILSRQIVHSRAFSRCSGFVFYSYSAFFGDNVSENAKKELQFVTSVL